MNTNTSAATQRRALAYHQWLSQRASNHLNPPSTPNEAAGIYSATVQALEASLHEQRENGVPLCQLSPEIVFFISDQIKKLVTNEHDDGLALLASRNNRPATVELQGLAEDAVPYGEACKRKMVTDRRGAAKAIKTTFDVSDRTWADWKAKYRVQANATLDGMVAKYDDEALPEIIRAIMENSGRRYKLRKSADKYGT